MRVIQADCEIEYIGRCITHLPRSPRIIIVKDDDSVIVHTNLGIKPVNYMPHVKNISMKQDEGNLVIVVSNLHETLNIKIYDLIDDNTFSFEEYDLHDDLEKRRSEKELQDKLELCFDTVMPEELSFLCREFETGKGPVDLLAYDNKRECLALIEVKRKAKLKDIYQVLRYAHGIAETYNIAISEGILELPIHAKGDNEHVTMLPVSAFAATRLFISAESFTKGAREESKKNMVEIVETCFWNDV